MQDREIRIGISGWRYEPWRGVFYPKTLRQVDELKYASRQLNFDEINGTFYSLQRPSSFQAWYKATPDDFVFSIKAPQYITHMRRLKNVKKPLANFYASGILELGKKFGPILWQFPPNFKFDVERMESFFEQLPRNLKAIAKLARGHDDHLKAHAVVSTKLDHPVRHAVEIRHYSFKTPEFVAVLLRKHNVALVTADTAGKWPVMEDLTADFCYIRLHGDKKIYVSGYDDKALDEWARKIKLWKSGREPADAKRVTDPIGDGKRRDIFVAFDNDVKVRAPVDAIALCKRLGIPAGEAREKLFQQERFTK